MTKRILPIAVILIVAGLLVWQRFNVKPSVNVVVTASTSKAYSVGDTLKRGQTIETQTGEFLLFDVGNVHVAMSEKTTLELKRLFTDERILVFPRGRIWIENPQADPFFIDTVKTQNTLTQGTATFVNFDFLQTVHIIPLKKQVQTRLTGTNDFMLIPSPLAIREVTPPTFEKISFDLTQNAASSFYAWIDENQSHE